MGIQRVLILRQSRGLWRRRDALRSAACGLARVRAESARDDPLRKVCPITQLGDAPPDFARPSWVAGLGGYRPCGLRSKIAKKRVNFEVFSAKSGENRPTLFFGTRQERGRNS